MKLTLKNIGKINRASVEIKGITVIAGENNTGKSTVGRSLFSVFNSFYNIQEQIEEYRTDSIRSCLDQIFISGGIRYGRFSGNFDSAKAIISDIDLYRQLEFADVKRKIKDLLLQDEDINMEFDDKVFSEQVSRIKEVLDVSDINILKSVLERKLDSEFNGQVRNIFSNEDGEIQLQIKDDIITVLKKNDGSVDISNPKDITLHTEAVYIDDPFIIDESRPFYIHVPKTYTDHRYHLRNILFRTDAETNVLDEIIVKDKIGKIFEKLSSVCSGDIIRYKRGTLGYQKKDSDKVLNIKNLSTGLKTFVILKILLTRGVIENNGTIILDEPEIHLHPEWQILFAELIVLIQKEFGVHVLLNTHSPYFLRAIQIYSEKYEISEVCKYYLTEVTDDNVNINDVSDNIEEIYAKLYYPLQRIEDERCEDD